MDRDFWNTQPRVVTEALSSLRWYQRTRPGAERLLPIPAFCIAVTLLFAVVWGELHVVVLGVLFAAAFALLAGQLAGELREREAEATSAAAIKPEVAPLLARIAEPRSEATEGVAEVAVQDEAPVPPEFRLPQLDPAPSLGARVLPRLAAEAGAAPDPAEAVQPVELPARDDPVPAAGLAWDDQDDEPSHEVREAGGGPVLHTCHGFLDACDFAFEYIDEHDPAELEIVRVAGGRHEPVWSYARSDADASRRFVEERERFFETIGRRPAP